MTIIMIWRFDTMMMTLNITSVVGPVGGKEQAGLTCSTMTSPSSILFFCCSSCCSSCCCCCCCRRCNQWRKWGSFSKSNSLRVWRVMARALVMATCVTSSTAKYLNQCMIEFDGRSQSWLVSSAPNRDIWI